jgi:hypothetical protein
MHHKLTAIITAAVLVATPLAALAQGMGPGGGPGRGAGPCAQGKSPDQCWRTQNPEKHAACWSKANNNGLRGPARRTFMMDCMTK